MRRKKHDGYNKLKGYQLLQNISDAEMAEHLGIKMRTYQAKINGWSDFTPLEARAISEKLGRSQDEIF